MRTADSASTPLLHLDAVQTLALAGLALFLGWSLSKLRRAIDSATLWPTRYMMEGSSFRDRGGLSDLRCLKRDQLGAIGYTLGSKFPEAELVMKGP